jgi:hypothetical protein
MPSGGVHPITHCGHAANVHSSRVGWQRVRTEQGLLQRCLRPRFLMGSSAPTLALLGVAYITLCGCSDVIRPLQSARSPAGDVEARYVQVLYGGAAGGMTYCVNLRYALRKDDCVIAAIHVRKGGIAWSGRRLIYRYCGGEITNNDSGVRRPSGVIPFAVEARETCS